MKDLEEGDRVDKEADCEDGSLVLMLYSTSADNPSPPEIMSARSVLRRRATDGGPFAFDEAEVLVVPFEADGDLDVLVAPPPLLLLLLPAGPLELLLVPDGAA